MERMLARRPEDRYPDASALVEALEALWAPARPGDQVADPHFWLWSGTDTHDDEIASTHSAIELMSRADGSAEDAAYQAEVRSALEAWDAMDEAPAVSDGIGRMIEDAWSEDGAAWGDPVKSPLDTSPIDAAAPKKGKFLMTATWRLDLRSALEEIDDAPVEEHERKRLSRDPGQAEVNTLLRDGPAPSAGWGGKVRRTPSAELAELTQAIEDNPDHPQPWTRRGIARARQNDLAGAVEDYSRALKLDPRYLPALANRASARYHLKQYDKVVEDCTRALRRQPRLAKAWLFRGLAKAHLGSGTDAREDLFKFLRLAPYSPYVNYIRRVLSGGSSSD
jgi:tetratricopeptide (TPR) repeat protein